MEEGIVQSNDLVPLNTLGPLIDGLTTFITPLERRQFNTSVEEERRGREPARVRNRAERLIIRPIPDTLFSGLYPMPEEPDLIGLLARACIRLQDSVLARTPHLKNVARIMTEKQARTILLQGGMHALFHGTLEAPVASICYGLEYIGSYNGYAQVKGGYLASLSAVNVVKYGGTAAAKHLDLAFYILRTWVPELERLFESNKTNGPLLKYPSLEEFSEKLPGPAAAYLNLADKNGNQEELQRGCKGENGNPFYIRLPVGYEIDEGALPEKMHDDPEKGAKLREAAIERMHATPTLIQISDIVGYLRGLERYGRLCPEAEIKVRNLRYGDRL